MLRKNGIEIMESTAFGVGNLFEHRFMDAWLAKLAGKRHHRQALFFPWFTNPKNTVSLNRLVDAGKGLIVVPKKERK